MIIVVAIRILVISCVLLLRPGTVWSQTRADTAAVITQIASTILRESQRQGDHQAPFFVDGLRSTPAWQPWLEVLVAEITRRQPAAVLSDQQPNDLVVRITIVRLQGDSARTSISFSRCNVNGAYWTHDFSLLSVRIGSEWGSEWAGMVRVADGYCHRTPPSAG
jgi:hypothetical protein